MSRRPRRALRGAQITVLLALLIPFATACETVEPWEREQLASPRMQSEPHAPHAHFVDHVRQSREAAAAAPSSSGAGCGCY